MQAFLSHTYILKWANFRAWLILGLSPTGRLLFLCCAQTLSLRDHVAVVLFSAMVSGNILPLTHILHLEIGSSSLGGLNVSLTPEISIVLAF